MPYVIELQPGVFRSNFRMPTLNESYDIRYARRFKTKTGAEHNLNSYRLDSNCMFEDALVYEVPE
jgi:hypothetical protein